MNELANLLLTRVQNLISHLNVGDWNVAKEILMQNGFQVLGAGMCRMVFYHVDFGGLVVKLSTENDNYSNRQECSFYCECPEEFKGHFAATYAASHDYRIIIAERVCGVPVRDVEGEPYYNLPRFEGNIRASLVWFGWNAHDLHEGNVFYFCGEYKIVDYGYFCKA